ncbi:FtsK/SpoIIIE domain-containing protein [uncultured Desulfovibrio sp.]|uniref:FtsK/SpoIIIE domain-containing protein n=1 Tax=uncultured Desulfovibrio sp. TaxID=167968 RepID=UPI0026DD6104|nr:FtsK/SpoIIIE domain-containing protein [uncultured Desulfovibrio sp.]
MIEISTQQILNSRFRTSSIADDTTIKMMENLGLSTKAGVARLAISRSLAMGCLPDEKIDAKGLEIPATSLFSQQDVAIWLGLCITHSIKYSESVISSMEAFREAIRRHWHRGVLLLEEDWKSMDCDYDRFLETLTNRRANLLEKGAVHKNDDTGGADVELKSLPEITDQLVSALSDISVVGKVKGIIHGPRLSRYIVYLPDVNMVDKLRKGLERLSLALGLQDGLPVLTRGEKSKTVNLDIPRHQRMWKRCTYADIEAWAHEQHALPSELLLFPGVDVLGNPFIFDLAQAPHLMVAGATGQGKSVCLHAIIASLMLMHSPSSLSIALIDPKQVEFSFYSGSSFLYKDKISVSMEDIKSTFFELVDEMDHRYALFKKYGVKNIDEANSTGLKFKKIVVIIEELADILLQDGGSEDSIARLAQLARAAGIHLVVATQRPDSKTFSGLIRGNITARIALAVQKSTESKIILDETGAEHLLGNGDMLIKTAGKKVTRVHGAYISQADIKRFLK